MLKKRKNSVDKGKLFEALLKDLSKAFDYLLHDLIIAKIILYGFSFLPARLIHSYLSDKKQKN